MSAKPAQFPPSGLLTDEDLARLAEAAGLIKPFDPSLLSGCSYDLRVGKIVRSRNLRRTYNAEAADYYVESGECVTFQTLEEVDFRATLAFGWIVNKHSVLARGLVHPITKVDPGFTGPLAITLFNLGGVAEPIRYGQPLVSLVVTVSNKPPGLVYGVSQRPSYIEGSLDIAAMVDEPAKPLEDADLARMYGRPLARVYERLEKVEASVEAGLIKKAEERKVWWREFGLRSLFLLIGVLLAALAAYLRSVYLGSGSGGMP